MIFDFVVILLDIPALIWYGWLEVLVSNGHCGGDSGTTYGIYMQLVLGILFYITLRGLKTIFHTPMMIYQLRYQQQMGFWRKGCLSLLMQRILSFVSKT